MTSAQKSIYLRTWSAAAKAHGWNTVAGIAVAVGQHRSGATWESPELNLLLGNIYDLAEASAEERGRTLSADDLRHACSAAAIGRNVSSKRFTNSDLDRVLALLRVLASPTNLNHLVALQNSGETGERRRQVHVITSAAQPYWQSIAVDKFGHCDLDELNLPQLRQLALTVRTRLRARHEAIAA